MFEKRNLFFHFNFLQKQKNNSNGILSQRWKNKQFCSYRASWGFNIYTFTSAGPSLIHVIDFWKKHVRNNNSTVQLLLHERPGLINVNLAFHFTYLGSFNPINAIWKAQALPFPPHCCQAFSSMNVTRSHGMHSNILTFCLFLLPEQKWFVTDGEGLVWWAPSNTTGTSRCLSLISPDLSLSLFCHVWWSLSRAAPGSSSLSDKHTDGRLRQKVETKTCCYYLKPFWSDSPRTLTQPVPMACDGGRLNAQPKYVKSDSGFHNRLTCLTKCPITIGKEKQNRQTQSKRMQLQHFLHKTSFLVGAPLLGSVYYCYFYCKI